MYIQNATYKTVPTAGLTFPLTEGTVLTVGDVTGIVPENIALAAPTGLIYLATGGTIDLTSEANAGITFTDAELNALSGDFNFIPLAESGGSSLPSYSSSDIGKVLTVGEDGAIWSGNTVRVLVNYDQESERSTINAPFSDIYNMIQNGVKVVLYSVYEGEEYDEGYISGISTVTAPVLWLNISRDNSRDVTTATAGNASDSPTYSYGYGVEQIEFTLNGSTWSCNKTYAQLQALGSDAPVYAEIPVSGLPNGSGMMTLKAVMHMQHGGGISCTFDDTNEPFSKSNPDRYYISGAVFADGFVDVSAYKYSVGVTSTNLLT